MSKITIDSNLKQLSTTFDRVRSLLILAENIIAIARIARFISHTSLSDRSMLESKVSMTKAAPQFDMTQANEPEDRGMEARLEERISRLERTTVPNDYIRRSFVDLWSAGGNRVYQDMTDLHYKIDTLAIEVDGVKQNINQLNIKIDTVSDEMNGKLDLIVRRLTGMN